MASRFLNEGVITRNSESHLAAEEGFSLFLGHQEKGVHSWRQGVR